MLNAIEEKLSGESIVKDEKIKADEESSDDQEIFSTIGYREEVDIIMNSFIKRIDKALKSATDESHDSKPKR